MHARRSADKQPPTSPPPVAGGQSTGAAERKINILSSLHSKILFGLIVLAEVMFVVFAPAPTGDPLTNVRMFTVAAILGISAFTTADDAGSFYVGMAFFGIIFGPLVTLILFSQSPTALIVWIVLVVLSSFLFCSVEGDGSLSWLQGLYILWISTGVVILAGHFGYVPHYELIALHIPLDLGLLRTIIDIRFLATGLFVVWLACSAIYNALGPDAPKLPHVNPFPPIAVKVDIEIIDALILPFLVAASFILKAFHIAIDIIWVAVATLAVYLYRIAVQLANRLTHLLTSQRVWKPLGQLYGTYVLVYIACIVLREKSPSAAKYVFTSPPGLTGYIPDILALSVALLFAVVAACALWGVEVLGAIARVALTSALLVIAFACSGVLLFLLHVVGVIGINGFEAVGPISLTILIILGAILGGYLVRSFAKI